MFLSLSLNRRRTQISQTNVFLPSLPPFTQGASAATTCPAEARVPMNESQEAAVNAVLTGVPVTLIQGPPGTGKTLTCAEIVRRWLQSDSSAPVLVVAETNEGVDNLIKKLAEHLPAEPGDLVRVGSPGWSASGAQLPAFSLEKLYRERRAKRRSLTRWTGNTSGR